MIRNRNTMIDIKFNDFNYIFNFIFNFISISIISNFLVQMNLIEINIFIFNFKLILYYDFILFFSSNEPN